MVPLQDTSSMLVPIFPTCLHIIILLAEKAAQLDHEIQSSAEAIVQAAQHSLPFFRPRRQKKKYVNDASLHAMCHASKAAWDIWRNGGRPQSGPMYELMRQRKKDVRSYVRSCRVREERSRLQERDRLFRDRDSSFLHSSQQYLRSKVSC